VKPRDFLDGSPADMNLALRRGDTELPTPDRRNLPAAAGGAAIAIGLLAIAGWLFDAPLLRSTLPNVIAMQPITAIALVMSGAALLAAPRQGLAGAFGHGLSIAILLLAVLDLGEFLTGADAGVDRLLFPDAVAHQPVALAHPGRMAEATAACFLFFSTALFLLRTRGPAGGLAFATLATAILVPAGLTLLGYLFGAALLPEIFGFTQISMPTAVGLGTLAIGLLALRPEAGWLPLLRGDTVGAGAARRLLPIVLLVPLVVGSLAKAGAEAGLYPPDLQLAIMVSLSIAMLAAITTWAASRFDRLGTILRTEHALREAEQRLIQSQAELIHASRVSELGTMGSTLAHELNQPLTAISNYLAVARHILDSGTPAAPRELKRAVAHALESTERAAQIIRRLRAFVVTGKVEKVPHDINAIIENALILALAGGVLKSAGTEVKFDRAARWVLVDPIQIEQVLTNLLRNAVEAMEGSERRQVTISTRRTGDMVEVSVADSGPGIADGDYELVFNSFYGGRGDGMGLGLSICRTIVDAHGGRIWGEPGETGAVFRFTLPAAPAPQSDPDVEAH
jgi:signal transduction histidine kinase